MLCIFPDQMIFEKDAVFSLQKFDLLVWVIKIWPYAHPLLHTPPSSWYDSFVDFTDFTDWVDFACYSLVWNVSKFYMSLLERAKAIHLVSIDKEPFFEVWYHEMSSTKKFNLGLLNLICQVRS